jgi:NhaP-type Na+/H+ or K+/H+ antiporter
MVTFEWIIVLLFGAALLSALARRLAIPYPTLLAIGGACLAFVPNNPGWTLDSHLALTLFVAPVLLDAAYDSSPRDLKDNWRSVASLAITAVGATTAVIALVAHALVPGMPSPLRLAPSLPRRTQPRRRRCCARCACRTASSPFSKAKA